MTTRIILILITLFFTSSVYSTNIRVLDFQKLIDNNINISNLYELIDKDQVMHKEKFKNEELNLQNELERIEKLNLILEPNELEKEINIYNEKLNNFNNKIEKFNLHYEIQINNLKNNVINIILDLLEQYSKDNNIELILDSKNYILSSNSINITEIIQKQANNKTLELNFEKY